MANPVFNDKILSRISVDGDTAKMTIEGTINKTGFLFLFLVAGAVLGWNSTSPALLVCDLIFCLVTSFLIAFKPVRASYLSQPYALGEGVLLGMISSMYAVQYPGIVSNALILTFSCLGIMLVLYRFRIVRVTEKLRSVVMVATMAIGVTYMISMIMGIWGSQIPMIHQSSAMGIGFSVVVVGVAAFNLLLDFDMIEQASLRGAPRFMEWYGGFALVVTLVWLYLEILRLLSKLNKK